MKIVDKNIKRPLHLQVVQSPPSSSWPSSWSRCHHLGSQGGWRVQGFVKVPVVGRPTRASSKLNILRISFDLTSADSIKVARQSQTHIFAHLCVFGLKCNQNKLIGFHKLWSPIRSLYLNGGLLASSDGGQPQTALLWPRYPNPWALLFVALQFE